MVHGSHPDSGTEGQSLCKPSDSGHGACDKSKPTSRICVHPGQSGTLPLPEWRGPMELSCRHMASWTPSKAVLCWGSALASVAGRVASCKDDG